MISLGRPNESYVNLESGIISVSNMYWKSSLGGVVKEKEFPLYPIFTRRKIKSPENLNLIFVKDENT